MEQHEEAIMLLLAQRFAAIILVEVGTGAKPEWDVVERHHHYLAIASAFIGSTLAASEKGGNPFIRH